MEKIVRMKKLAIGVTKCFNAAWVFTFEPSAGVWDDGEAWGAKEDIKGYIAP